MLLPVPLSTTPRCGVSKPVNLVAEVAYCPRDPLSLSTPHHLVLFSLLLPPRYANLYYKPSHGIVCFWGQALAKGHTGSLTAVGAGGPAPAGGAAPEGGSTSSSTAAQEKKGEAKKEESEKSNDDMGFVFRMRFSRQTLHQSTAHRRICCCTLRPAEQQQSGPQKAGLAPSSGHTAEH
ncbi:hypothetical protein HPG69_019372 [Diceros bicornis minor]|uniref:Uncharacterized protein n=1 Tax=Diceros bicornis minor TaxID=77932 RepID=A0A7J7E926_DICBM|nr:hypothetical protein HPG69_019372 [Diceros bicornis minor]